MLPAPETIDHLTQMLADAAEVRALVCSRPIDALADDRVTCLAVERLLQRIADTAGRIDATARDSLPGVPWQRLEQLRRTVATDHRAVDPRLLYAIGSRDAPELIKALQMALPSDDD